MSHPVPQSTSELVEESEDDMSSLATRFVAQMRKRVASAQWETILDSKVPSGKRPKWYGLEEEVQKSSTIVTLDSLE